MDRDGYIKLAVFGLAMLIQGEKNKLKIALDKNEDGEFMCGTIESMAPEIF